MSKPIAMIYNGVWSHYVVANAPKYRDLVELLYVHDLAPGALADFAAVVVPFQSHQGALATHREEVFSVLARGGKVFVEGDCSWLEEAWWEDRPLNNYWWICNPNAPPVTDTDFSHPVYRGLTPRQSGWHTHGAYTQIPSHARVIQRGREGEVVTWETHAYGGTLLVTTLDPLVEHGVQQIRHLDHYVDSLLEWLCGVRPTGSLEIDWRIPPAPAAPCPA